MASTTRTVTIAQAAAPLYAPLGSHTISYDNSGIAASLSASASAVLLLAKIPPQAKDVQILWQADPTGATGAKLQFGIKSGDSVTASALVALTDIAVTNTVGPILSARYTPTWDDSAGETVKYVQCSVGSGTVSAGFVLRYQVTYNMNNDNG